MAGVNFAVLVGNVGADPEIRKTTSGQPVAGFSLATSESWNDKQTGEKKERTEWHRIVVFSEGLVGVVEKYVKKGSKLFVKGPIRTREWTDQSNVKRYTTEIVLSGFEAQLQLLDRAGARPPGDSEADYKSGASYADVKGRTGETLAAEMDDEIPF